MLATNTTSKSTRDAREADVRDLLSGLDMRLSLARRRKQSSPQMPRAWPTSGLDYSEDEDGEGGIKPLHQVPPFHHHCHHTQPIHAW